MLFKVLSWICVTFAAVFFYSVATGEDVSATLLSDLSQSTDVAGY